VMASGLGPDPDALSGEPTPTLTPSLTPTLTPTSVPDWIAKLVRRVAKDCNDATAAQAEAEITSMSEAQATEYAEELVRSCQDDRDAEDD